EVDGRDASSLELFQDRGIVEMTRVQAVDDDRLLMKPRGLGGHDFLAAILPHRQQVMFSGKNVRNRARIPERAIELDRGRCVSMTLGQNDLRLTSSRNLDIEVEAAASRRAPGDGDRAAGSREVAFRPFQTCGMR